MSRKDDLAKKIGPNIDASVRPRDPEATPPTVRVSDGRLRNRDLGDVALDQVIADPDQPRKVFEPEALARLTESIRARGVKQPISVRRHDGLGKWMVVCGERRFRAATAAGLKTIPARFIEGELTPDEIFEEQLVENLHREDLSPMDQARAFDFYARRHGWSASELADKLALHKGTVSRSLALLDLPREVQDLVESGQLGGRAAAEVGRLDTPEEQIDMARRVVAGKLPFPETARQVREKLSRDNSGGGGGDPDTLPLPRPPATTHTLTLSRGVKVSIAFGWQPVTGPEIVDALREALQHAEAQQGDRAAA